MITGDLRNQIDRIWDAWSWTDNAMVERECTIQVEAQQREVTRWVSSRALAKQLIFGY